MPAMQTALGGSVFQMQVTISGFLVGFGVSQLFFGPLSDRLGRRNILIGGLLVYLVASIFAAFAPSIEILVVSRIFQGVGACAGAVISRAVVRDVFGPEGSAKVLAYMMAAMALVPGIAPIVGGFVDVAYGWRANFYIMMTCGFIAVLLAVFFLKETNHWQDQASARVGAILLNYLSLCRNRRYRGYLAPSSAVIAGGMIYLSEAPFLMAEILQFQPNEIGYGVAILFVGNLLGAVFAGKLATRIGLDTILLMGIALAAISGLIAYYFAAFEEINAYRLIGPYILYATAMGVVMPTGMAAAIAPFPKMAGTATAFMGFTAVLSNALTITLVGILRDGSALPMTGASALLATLALILFAATSWKNKN